MEQGKKCVRKKRKCFHPNLLFKKWLTEWKEDAQEKNSNMQYNFHRALKSLELYPLPLYSGADCKILMHFGDKLCAMIDRKLKMYTEENGQINWDDFIKIAEPKRNKKKSVLTPKVTKKSLGTPSGVRSKVKRAYIPVYRSGAYALLLTLSDATENTSYEGFLKKETLIDIAQELCDTSFTIPANGSHYTAWSSMSNLIKKGLVFKCGNPGRYSITDDGKMLAKQIKDKKGDVISIQSNKDLPTSSALSNVHSISDSESEEVVPIEVSLDSDEVTIIEDDEDALVYCAPAKQGVQFGKEKPLPPSRLPSSVKVDTVSAAVTLEKDVSVACDYQLLPGTFQLVLCVDSAETCGGFKAGKKNMKDAILAELTRQKVNFDVRKLHIGDFLWVAQELSASQKKRELVLPFVVERKRIDDLASSIMDGRFKEQKFRLKQCGLGNPIYLVEEYGSANCSLPLSTCEQAIANTQIIDAFQVKLTANIHESISYLTNVTKYLQNRVQTKMLRCLPKERVCQDFTKIIGATIDLMDFAKFNALSMKNKQLNVRDMFSKHLLQLNGLSIDKAAAIIEKYPTPRLLIRALNKCHSQIDKEFLLSTLKCARSGRLIGPRISSSIVQLYSSHKLA